MKQIHFNKAIYLIGILSAIILIIINIKDLWHYLGVCGEFNRDEESKGWNILSFIGLLFFYFSLYQYFKFSLYKVEAIITFFIITTSIIMKLLYFFTNHSFFNYTYLSLNSIYTILFVIIGILILRIKKRSFLNLKVYVILKFFATIIILLVPILFVENNNPNNYFDKFNMVMSLNFLIISISYIFGLLFLIKIIKQ